MEVKLYKDKPFKAWTKGKLQEVILEQWSFLRPVIEKEAEVYSTKSTIFIFSGDVTVAVELVKEPHSPSTELHTALSLSLSPKPFNISTHVLNTFDFGYFINSLPEYSDVKVFNIGKEEPWSGSTYSSVIDICGSLIEAMLDFDTCFDILTRDTFVVKGRSFDTRRNGFTQFLTRVKAYRFAEIYNRADKLDAALEAIQLSVETNDMAREKIQEILNKKDIRGLDWLYTPELVEALRERNVS